MEIQQLFELAIQHHESDRLDEAERLYIQVLRDAPEHAGAFHGLGLIAHQIGRNDMAVELMTRSIELAPATPHFYNSLGNALKALWKINEAIVRYREALTLNPGYAEAYNNLGVALKCQGQWEEAIHCYQKALGLKPNLAEVQNNLGVIYKEQERLDDAVECYRLALSSKPDYAEAYSNLGIVFQEQKKWAQSMVCFERAVALRPDFAGCHLNIGIALKTLGRLEAAISSLNQALILKPDLVEAHNNLGAIFKDQGKLDEALASFKQASALEPEVATPAGNIAYLLHFHPDYDTRMIMEECRKWNQIYARPLAPFILPHSNLPDPNRKLRIGYVSPDFSSHPVGRFLLPLIEQHDRDHFELFAYAQVKQPDAVTARFRSLMDHWQVIFGLSDAQLADRIREDRIDLLVDLTMHMAGNRLLVFARKPAPIQVTWLAYCSSTGLDTMDYRLSDPYLDPMDRDESLYSEQTIRLPETYWCYQPTGEEPAAGPSPGMEKGFITFGCLNNFAKVTPPVIETWKRILQSIPNSRLLIHSAEGNHRFSFLQEMEQAGVVSERIHFIKKMLIGHYFESYRDIDIALDSFPYGGGTTSCDALWMGVPIVSLAEERAVGRGGLSLLSNLGLNDLIGHSPDEYVQIALNLARNLPRLVELRATLRSRMLASPIMDAPRFARHMETAYRQMWHHWILNRSGGQTPLV